MGAAAGRSMALRVWAAVAACAYVLDAWVVGQGTLLVLACFAMVVAGVVEVSRSLVGDRQRMLTAGALLVLAAFTVTAGILTIRLQNTAARARADRVIAALDAYHAAHGAYPPSLDALVPEELPSIPRAKWTLLFGEFTYGGAPEAPHLYYVVLPPFGRRSFDLTTHTWGSLD